MASKLAQMQMRFQQKQQQEREQRRLELTSELNQRMPGNNTNGNTTNNNNNNTKVQTSAVTKNIGNGKVRQMFDERRRGIDRSNPLKPIRSAESVNQQTTNATITNSRSMQNHQHSTEIRKQNGIRRVPFAAKNTSSEENLVELNGHTNDNGNGNRYSEVDGHIAANNISDDHLNNNETHLHVAMSETLVLNPVITKKSPKALSSSTRSPPVPLGNHKISSPKSAGSEISTKSQNHITKPVRKSVPASPAQKQVNASPQKSMSSSANMATASGQGRPLAPQNPPAEGMVGCKFCGRYFNEERIKKHEQVCQKIATTKRKVFDVTKQRIKGTDLEDFSRRKPMASKGQRAAAGAVVGAQRLNVTTSQAAAGGAKKSNWRQKHEDFIKAIRAAKQVQAHLARGGKLSDLPPPPPSENPDYIQCPHCLRRFNQTAAERHIPKCATMLHNKPKPGAAGAAKRR